MYSPILADKKIVVIGGTTGLGLSATKALINEGAKVVAVGIDESQSNSAVDELGDNAKVITADALLESTAENAIAAAVRHFGGFDGLYHIAGGSGRRMGDGPLHEMTIEGWHYTLNLNLTSMDSTHEHYF